MCFDAHLLAHFQNGAGGAVRQVTGADVFPKGDEQTIDLNPIAAGQFFAERNHCLLRGGCFYIAPAIGHTMDMYIYADEWLAASDT